ncbi:uncharacterized protein CIMG_06143 [Coccidioides immitis RS]|uniref:Mid2 domain-containing protein n=3 Tax=Coccidioides immitis TaxID=5501 RepID=A0A0E1S1Q7_COCIM|nr:uncharacterized protein CIMG_06143 [Coccidioides immitis RS]EAS30664.1 hypothetical protein CIMG_06143 [Coccidioides immitis RS]KMP03227.1 hypothetical protein CIRG_02919 [Coccidioides immitis RMSCC 2394]KMU84807.1 hypothetical protein CIHG_02591 [Coccidioides immitis H538.4]TPX23589.1 hypothetical protein DIZ76_012923 [Coccidioides immitis]
MARLSQRWLPLYLQSFLAAVAFTATCYFPDGGESNRDVPCSSDEFTACCRHNHVCLSNGLCMQVGDQPFVISRGSCTDRNWDSARCPPVCHGPDDNPSGGAVIVPISSGREPRYCCLGSVVRGSETTCVNDAEPFTLNDGEVVIGYAALSGVVRATAPTGTSSAPTATNSPSASSTPGGNAPSHGSSSSNSTNIAIGAGVGVPLGVIALVSIAWALYERRQRRRCNIPPEQLRFAEHPMPPPPPPAMTGYSSQPELVQHPPVELNSREIKRT